MNTDINSNKKFTGVISALVTPFADGKVDLQSLEKLVSYQLDRGIQGFVINGTTAESPNLTEQEVAKIFSAVRVLCGMKMPLILGTGSNSTEKTISNTKKAEDLGADAVLVVVPYYNKPPQRGLVQHFKEVARSTSLPVIMYNVPGRTITSMSVETVVELSEFKNIIGLKEASGDMSYDEQLFKKIKPGFRMLSGDDGTYLQFLKMGGQGIISVMSNLITAECVRWTQDMLQGKVSETEKHFERYKPLIQVMYVEANPIPLKWMLYKKGLIQSPEARLPLMSLDTKYHKDVEQVLNQTEIL